MSAVARPSPLVPGYYLDRYELLCPLAEGGMASVWMARLTGKHGFEKLVAIKTILPEFAADERFRKMFLDEARIASRIEHTNVAQILDLGEQHDILYLVMEYVDGDSLSRLFKTLKRNNLSLPPSILLRIAADACGGLQVAHDLAGNDGKPLGVVHRDVSPQNLLISMLGVTKLIDFGIAKARGRLGEDTNAGLLKGKIHYMAPEQAVGGDVDRRTDVFAVGCILYHLLSGKPPYEGQGHLAILHKLMSKEPFAPLPPSVPPPIAAIVNRSLAHDPAARFATAADMQNALELAIVETRLACTTADIANFVKMHMAERATKRKEAIELAIKAAAERQRMRQLLRPPMSEASMVGVPGAASSSGAVGLGIEGVRALQALGSGSSPGVDSASGVLSASPAPFEAAIPVEFDSPKKRRLLYALGAAGAVLASVIGTVVILSTHHAPAAAAPVTGSPVEKSTGPSPVTTAAPPTTGIATVSIDDLPEVPSAKAAPPKPLVAATAAAPPSTGKKHHRENYGF